MANSKVSDLTAASTLDGTELVYAVQGGADRKATVTQINASRQPLDATLTALAALDSSAGYLKQTGADAFSKVTEFAVTDMVALRTFVRPPGIVGNAGGFYQQNLYQIAVPSPDALCGQVTVNVKITDATKSGSYYYRSTFLITRSSLADQSSVPAGLIQTAYLGDSGTSVGVVQLQVGSSATSVVLFLIQPLGFTSPSVTITAVMVLPGTNTVTLSP